MPMFSISRRTLAWMLNNMITAQSVCAASRIA
jgi:hypothetical protein